MNYKHKNLYTLFIIIFFLTSVSVCFSASIPAMPSKYVVDLAGIIDEPTENSLNGYLEELEQKTTAQFIILTINSLDGESIEDFSINIAHNKWKLGQKGKDNGLLFLIAFKDRKYRMEVGYGLEGILPDSLVGSIGRNILVPYFKKGAYSKGIYTAAVVMADKIAADAGVKITGMPRVRQRYQPERQRKPAGFFSTVLTIIFFVIMFILFLKNPKLFLLFFLFSSMGGRRGSWGGGGGFGGGGFGSFGGGGGGGFGGGGASGGW